MEDILDCFHHLQHVHVRTNARHLNTVFSSGQHHHQYIYIEKVKFCWHMFTKEKYTLANVIGYLPAHLFSFPACAMLASSLLSSSASSRLLTRSWDQSPGSYKKGLSRGKRGGTRDKTVVSGSGCDTWCARDFTCSSSSTTFSRTKQQFTTCGLFSVPWPRNENTFSA